MIFGFSLSPQSRMLWFVLIPTTSLFFVFFILEWHFGFRWPLVELSFPVLLLLEILFLLRLRKDGLATYAIRSDAQSLERSEPVTIDEELLQSQKMEVVGRLAGGVAHDFNNLLTVICGYCQMLQPRMAQDEEALEMVNEILKASDRAAVLTRQLLAFSRKQVLRPQYVDVNQIVQQVEKMLSRLLTEKIELILELSPEPLPVHVDPTQLEQVVLNLAINARDAMPGGGKLILSTSVVNGTGTPTSSTDAPGHAQLSVTDTGVGISSQVLSKIFEPFFTTKEEGKGTGLGLSMVHGFVMQSGGQLKVESELGKGSTFWIQLPLVAVSLEQESMAQPVSSLPKGHETILVIEDEEAVSSLVQTALIECGYNVIAAKDGVEALRISFRASPAPELVLTDVVMPGPGGVDIAQQLQRLFPSIKTIYMSGYNESELIRSGLECNIVEYLSKPFSIEELVSTVREVLDKPNAARSPSRLIPSK